MLRLRLQTADLARVDVADGPAPLIELGHHVRARGADTTDADLLRALLTSACTPGFLQPHVTDPDRAVETVCSVPPARAGRDLADNVAAGYPLPPWAVEFTRRGVSGVQLRRRLELALVHQLRAVVVPALDDAAPRVAERVGRLRSRQDQDGPAGALGHLGDAVRLRGRVLEIDLSSGAEVETTSAGAGLTLVPTLAAHPTVTVSSRGGPTVVAFPVGRGRDGEAEDLDEVPVGLADLIGGTRARLLTELARHPHLGVRALARACGVAPATASQHLAVLRAGGLVTPRALGPGHHLTPLGHRLLRGH